MGLFGVFKKKEERMIPELEEVPPLSDSEENLGMNHDENNSIPEIEINPIHEQYKAQQANQSSFSHQGFDAKDTQIIISKLDLINARLENLNERLLSLERALAAQEKRRW